MKPNCMPMIWTDIRPFDVAENGMPPADEKLVDELMNHTNMREYHHHHDMHRVRIEKRTVKKGRPPVCAFECKRRFCPVYQTLRGRVRGVHWLLDKENNRPPLNK